MRRATQILNAAATTLLLRQIRRFGVRIQRIVIKVTKEQVAAERKRNIYEKKPSNQLHS